MNYVRFFSFAPISASKIEISSVFVRLHVFLMDIVSFSRFLRGLSNHIKHTGKIGMQLAHLVDFSANSANTVLSLKRRFPVTLGHDFAVWFKDRGSISPSPEMEWSKTIFRHVHPNIFLMC